MNIEQMISQLRLDDGLIEPQEENLVAYLGILPRDLKFALIKNLLTIPTLETDELLLAS